MLFQLRVGCATLVTFLCEVLSHKMYHTCRALDSCGWDSPTKTVDYVPSVMQLDIIICYTLFIGNFALWIIRWIPVTMPTPMQGLILSLKPEFLWLNNRQRSGSRRSVRDYVPSHHFILWYYAYIHSGRTCISQLQHASRTHLWCLQMLCMIHFSSVTCPGTMETMQYQLFCTYSDMHVVM